MRPVQRATRLVRTGALFGSRSALSYSSCGREGGILELNCLDSHSLRAGATEGGRFARFLCSRALSSHVQVGRAFWKSVPCPSDIVRRSLFTEVSRDHAGLQTLTGDDAGIALLVLNRPEARNAVGDEMLHQLKSIVEKLRFDSATRVLIVCSAVPGVFCAGADIKERRKKTPSEVQQYVTTLRSTYSAIEALPIPSIAVIEGSALGGGLELALSCDLRICGLDAILGLPETSLAIIPGAGGTQRLPRLIGRARAKELIFTARRIDAPYASQIGLVNHAVEAGGAYEKALEIAREIMQQGPIAVKMAKVAIDRGIEVEKSSGLVMEEACYAQTLHTKDRLEGLAAFAEKRKPFYKGE